MECSRPQFTVPTPNLREFGLGDLLEFRTTWPLDQVQQLALDDMEDAQSIQFLIDRLKSHKTNDEFFTSMKGGNGKKTR